MLSARARRIDAAISREGRMSGPLGEVELRSEFGKIRPDLPLAPGLNCPSGVLYRPHEGGACRKPGRKSL